MQGIHYFKTLLFLAYWNLTPSGFIALNQSPHPQELHGLFQDIQICVEPHSQTEILPFRKSCGTYNFHDSHGTKHSVLSILTFCPILSHLDCESLEAGKSVFSFWFLAPPPHSVFTLQVLKECSEGWFFWRFPPLVKYGCHRPKPSR